MSRWNIEVTQCEECRREHEEKERARDRWIKTHGSPPNTFWSEAPDEVEWNKFLIAYNAEVPNVPCFSFVADCGGDAIYLCLKHFAIASERLKFATLTYGGLSDSCK